MADIVLLTHRIPYPPDKGDKIRSYHILRHLVARHRVHLGTFIDDPRDRVHLDTLKALCADVCAINLDPRAARLRSLSGFLRGEPLTTSYYKNRRLRRWVKTTLAENSVDAIVAFSSGVAQFAESDEARRCRRVMDFVDVDSAKWRQYAKAASWPARLLYSREARTLGRLERRLAAEFDAALFVSPAEADVFRRRLTEPANVHGMSNGVDTDTFDPAAVSVNPYADGSRVIVFTGMMDYRANVDGVRWFADDILPRIRERMPEATFYIVGGRPTRDVRALASRSGVRVTGRVPRIAPYLRHAHVSVAPLRIARGIQNKVLEALAMGTPVIGTPQAFEGIDAFPGRSEATAANADDFAAAVVRTVSERDTTRPDGRLRDFVRERYDWETNLNLLDRLIDARSTARTASSNSAPLAQARS